MYIPRMGPKFQKFSDRVAKKLSVFTFGKASFGKADFFDCRGSNHVSSLFHCRGWSLEKSQGSKICKKIRSVGKNLTHKITKSFAPLLIHTSPVRPLKAKNFR